VREFDGNGSSSAPPSKAPEIPERTHAQRQQEAIAEIQRQLNSAAHQLEGVQRARDLQAWEASYTRLQVEIASSIEALEQAKQLQVDAATLTALQTQMTTLHQAAAAAKPPKRPELALESEISAALTAPHEGSAEAGHHRKERTIQALFQRLDVADSRALRRRIHQRLPEDRLVTAFHELVPSRQTKLQETLEDAGRREAVAAEPARRAARDAGREAAGGGVLQLGPASVMLPTPTPTPARGLPATSQAPTAMTAESEAPEAKLRRILEAGEPDDAVEAQLEALFGELDDATRRALAKRFERYRQGNGDDIAARFHRLDPPVRRRLLGALTAPPRHLPTRGPKMLVVTTPPGPTHPILLPGAEHPARRDMDGEQVIQTDKVTEPGKAAPLRYKSWKALAEVAESVDLQDDSGDTMHIDLTYRLESRPAEVGDVPDTWIHTERKALLTIGSGEHAGATIIGQARVHLAPEEALDPKAAIGKPSVGADHRAQIYLAEAQQYVHLHGAGGRPSLRADAADSDVLAYDDPLRTLIGLKNVLKQQHVAGHGADVATMHARAEGLLAEAQRGHAVLEREIQRVESYHDPHPGMVAPVRWLAGDIANWLAANHQQGRDHTEDARLLRKAHDELLHLLEAAEHARAPERDPLSDGLMVPLRFVGRTGEGLKEAGAMAVDTIAMGVDVLGGLTGIGTFDYHPISKYGQFVEATGAGTQAALVQLVNGFADEWSDALERAKHGDYRGLVDVGTDTLLMIDGARTGALAVIDQGEALAARIGGIARSARGIAGRLPAQAADIAMAMAEGADAFVAELHAGGMQMATSGAGGGPGPVIGGITGKTLAKAARAGGRAFTDEYLARAKVRGIQTIQQRLGTAKAPDVAAWITRVEAVFASDAKAVHRFLETFEARVTEPAPFLRKVDTLLAAQNIAADDLAVVLSSILDARIGDPVAVLDEIEWLSTRPLSAQARSTLIRRAVKGRVDLGWVKRTRLTDRELEIMGQDNNTAWNKFEEASDLPSRHHPGPLADRPPSDHGAYANARIRGIAGELVAQEMVLPNGLKIERRLIAGNAEPTTDFALRAPDGSVAELEAKALRPESWKEALDEYDEGLENSKVDPDNPVARLLRQVEVGMRRGHTVYVAISDGTSMRSRGRLLARLKGVGVLNEQLLLLPESEILRIGKVLREHMGIPQPTFPTKGGG
jgi:hypothetical protein